jgi:hypothetical protein
MVDRSQRLPDAGRRKSRAFDYIEKFYNAIRRHSKHLLPQPG